MSSTLTHTLLRGVKTGATLGLNGDIMSSAEQQVCHFPALGLPSLRSCFHMAQVRLSTCVGFLSQDCAQVVSKLTRTVDLNVGSRDQQQHLGTS